MVGKYKVITLCGSTRFKEAILRARKDLTLEGCIVLSPDVFGHSGDDEVWKEGMKELLDDLHLRKIDMADEVFVVNVDGYVGESTQREIDYARKVGKEVRYMQDPVVGKEGSGVAEKIQKRRKASLTDEQMLAKYPKVVKMLLNGYLVEEVAGYYRLSRRTVQKVKNILVKRYLPSLSNK